MDSLRRWSSKHFSEFTLFLLAAVTLLSINILTRDYHYLQDLASVTASYEKPIRIVHPPRISVAGSTSSSSVEESSSRTSPSVDVSDLKKLGIPTKTLSGGDEGEDVTSLQKFLQSQGFLSPNDVSSDYFGPKTENAVRKYQEARGLEITGRVGPLTREMWAKDLGIH